MKLPYKFNIVSGILAGFVVITLLVATTPSGFGVTRYDRTEALSAALVFFLLMCAVLWFTGRKSTAPAKKPPPDNRGIFPALILLQPTPMLEGPLAVKVLIGFLVLVVIGVLVWVVKRKGSGPKSGRP